VLDELRTGGQVYTIPVEAQGGSVKIRVYVDDQLVQEIAR